MKRLFVSVYRHFEKRPAVMWVLLSVITVLCALSALRLDFVEDISRFLPGNKDNNRINYAYEHLGGDNKLVVSVSMADTASPADPQLLTSAVEYVARELSDGDSLHLVKSLLCQVDDQAVNDLVAFVVENMPYFLSEEDYRRMDSMMTEEAMDSRLTNTRALVTAPVPMMRAVIERDPLFFSSRLLQSLESFRLNDSYNTDNGYIFSKDGKEAVLIVTSAYPLSETKNNAVLVRNIERAMSAAARDADGQVQLHCFGATQISLTNAQQIKRDSLMAVALSLLLIVALLYYYYRNVRSILLIVVCTAFGGLFALGAIALFKNPVSVIAVGVASVIIGIAINYPIHFLSHFKRTDDKEQIIREVVSPLLIGNITTVGAFLSLLFISSDAMRDLGLFAALLLVGTILFVLLFLPHLMGRHFSGKSRELTFKHIAESRPENVKGLFAAVLGLTVLFYVFSFRTSFDTDMHHINYMTEEQRETFDKLRSAADTSLATVYCIAEGASLDEALAGYENAAALLDSLRGDPAVASVSGIATFLPSRSMQEERLRRWENFWQGRREVFIARLDRAATRNGFAPAAFDKCKEIVSKQYQVQNEDFFAPVRQGPAAEYVSVEEDKALVYNILKVEKKQAPRVEERLNHEHPDVFSFTDSSIASRLVSALSDDFDYVLYICGFIVFAFLLFSFGRIELCLTAFLPLVIAWVWILGIMGMTGIRFNIVNIILATFIFGMGDDYSIFVTEGLIYEYASGRKMVSQFKNSIVLSAAIMFIGIGMLIFAKHPAMRSLAEVTIIGMFSVVLMAYIVPPVLFKWLTTSNGKPRRRPVTLMSILMMTVGGLYFILGFVVITLCGFVLLGTGRRTDRRRMLFHRLLQLMMKGLARILPGASFRVVNPSGEDFSKPAVIVCNHQSHLDLLYTLAMTPKLVVLTNEWAWNMPFYRSVLRYSDSMPVTNGMEQNVEKLREMAAKGYSLLVFPEGTRTENDTVGRFHQGAFFMAEALGMDILPVVLHGTRDMLPKHEMMVHKGSVTLLVGERIAPDNADLRKDKTCRDIARLVCRRSREMYGRLRIECETPDYLQDRVWHSYLYKGKEVATSCRRKMRARQQLADALRTVPENGTLLCLNCGYGELPLLAALLRRDVAVTACDPDPENFDIARNCTAVPDNLTYTATPPDTQGFNLVLDEHVLLK